MATDFGSGVPSRKTPPRSLSASAVFGSSPHDAGHDADGDQEPTDADDNPGELSDHFRHGQAGRHQGKQTDGRRQISRALRRGHKELSGAQVQDTEPLSDSIDHL